MTNTKRLFLALALASAAALPLSAGTFATANAATADDLNKDASQALQSLYKTTNWPIRFPRKRGAFSFSRASSKPASCSAAATAKAF